MVKHILKNGEEVKDISGHVIKKDDAPCLYELIKIICTRSSKREEENDD